MKKMHDLIQPGAEKLARFFPAPFSVIFAGWLLGYLGALVLLAPGAGALVRWGLFAVSMAVFYALCHWVGKEVGKEHQRSYEHAHNLLDYIRLETARLTYIRDNLADGVDEIEAALIARSLETLQRAERTVLATYPEKFTDSLTHELEAMLKAKPDQPN